MFKLKPGNVFQKLNTMDKKQAYTWGAIVVVCFIALITLASFLGDADEASFDGFNTRGYDLAQMPFINDEAEEYLLASKYPDMKDNGSTMLYSQAEKEARQEADAEAAAEEGDSAEDSSSDYSSSSSSGYSGRGYTGGGRGGGTGTPTQVGQLGSASMGHAGGSGMSGTFGAPRGDFSPYKSQEKGSEIQYQLKNTDAKKALSQFARTSRAAAGLKDGKGGNAKKALMGGNIKGSDAFTETGVDLSKAGGLELDTNAPTSSADLSNLDKKVSDGQKKAEAKKEEEEQDLSDRLLEQFLSGLIDLGMQALGGLMDRGLNAAFGAIDAYGAKKGVTNHFQDTLNLLTPDDVQNDVNLQNTMKNYLGGDYDAWIKDGSSAGSYIKTNNVDVKGNMKNNAGNIYLPSRDPETSVWTSGVNSLQTEKSRAASEARGVYVPKFSNNSKSTTNSGTSSKTDTGSVTSILSGGQTQTQKVDALVGQGLSKAAACQEVYGIPNC